MANGNFQIENKTDGITPLAITSSGKVGIGTSSPASFVESSRFVVGSGTNGLNEMMFLYSGTNAFGALGFADGTSGTAAYRGIVGYHHEDDELFFSTNGGGEANRDVTITSAGNVGIGTETPSQKLTVAGNISNVSGNMTLDVAGDIILDADGGDVRLKDNGTEFLNFYAGTIERTGSLIFDVSGNITLNADGSTISLNDGTINFGQFYQNASGQLNIYAPTQDKDIVFLGNDGGSTVTALRLDMSSEGDAIFNNDILLGDGNPVRFGTCLLYTSPSPRDATLSRMPSSA